MRKILVIQAARFGDLIQTKRLLLSLAGEEPHLAVDSSLAGLARILYPFAAVHAMHLHGVPDKDALSQNEKIFSELRNLDFEQVYNLNFSPLTETICRIFEPERIIGYRPARDSQGGLLRSPWARVAFELSTERPASPLNLADFWANFTANPLAPQKVNPMAKAGGKGLGIAVAGREERRSLSPEGLAAIAKTLFGLFREPEIRFFGTAAEARRARQAMRHFSASMLAKTTDLCGKTDWPGLIEEVRHLDLLLTPDTGLMHLAAALGVPCLAFFFSSAWAHETGPYGLGHTIIQAAPSCAPCLESAPCTQNLLCRQPFAPEHLPRLAAMAIGHAPLGAWPEPLQLWQSGLDSFGAKLNLAAGKDAFAERRKQARNFAAACLGAALPQAWAAPAWKRLMPASQWLLPPWRYC